MTRARYGCTTQLAALALITLVVAAVLALAGCSTDRQRTGSPGISTTYVNLSDGRSVLCVVYAGAQKGGIDCDWATAALEGEP